VLHASQQERRQRREKLKATIDRIERHGLTEAPELIDLAAVVALIDQSLERGGDGGRSSRVMRQIGDLHDKSNGSFASEIACRKGCTFCCSLYVSALPPDIFAIADFIRANSSDLAADIARIESADAVTRGVDSRGRFENKASCALLVDSACSVYAARPTACRAMMSRSRQACENAHLGVSIDESAMIDGAFTIRNAYVEALLVNLNQRGLVVRTYELTHAILVALKDETAERRWYAGEDVFTGVGSDGPTTFDGDALFWQSLWNVAHGDPLPDGAPSERFPEWCRYDARLYSSAYITFAVCDGMTALVA